jgi:cell division protein FtsB
VGRGGAEGVVISLTAESADAIDHVVDALRSEVRRLKTERNELAARCARLERENGDLLDELHEAREASRLRAELGLEG